MIPLGCLRLILGKAFLVYSIIIIIIHIVLATPAAASRPQDWVQAFCLVVDRKPRSCSLLGPSWCSSVGEPHECRQPSCCSVVRRRSHEYYYLGSTRRKASPTEDHDNKNEDDFLASLQARVQQIRASQLPLVILDDEFLLPRQVLEWTLHDPARDPVVATSTMELIRTRLQSEMPTFGVVGRSRSSGMICPMGVEVEIVEHRLSTVTKTSPNGAVEEQPCSSWRLKIRATPRVFRIQATSLSQSAQGWYQAPVEFVDWQADDEAAEDVFSMAVALQRAREFTEPNVSMNEEQSLIDMWIELARTKEITPGQIDRLLQDLGPRPSWKNPSDCAFWVAALINPVPTLGVAWEIRSKLLLAKTADERTQIALNGIWNSIQHMEAADNRFRQIKE